MVIIITTNNRMIRLSSGIPTNRMMDALRREHLIVTLSVVRSIAKTPTVYQRSLHFSVPVVHATGDQQPIHLMTVRIGRRSYETGPIRRSPSKESVCYFTDGHFRPRLAPPNADAL